MSFLIKLQAGNLKTSEATTEMFCKKNIRKKDAGVSEPGVHRPSAKQVLLNHSPNLLEKTCVRGSF